MLIQSRITLLTPRRRLGGIRNAERGIVLGAPLSRQDLAELTGTTLFTVSRTLKDWERRGILIAGREQVILLNTHALVAIGEDLLS